MRKVYVETTIVSYLTARPSRDLVVAAHQQITEEWWREQRKNYEFYISQSVVTEASAGNPEMAQRRLEAMESIDLLDITDEAQSLAKSLIEVGILPVKAAEDALHIALATVHGMNYLLTWNCKHIANAVIREKAADFIRSRGYRAPVICTPEELKEE